MIREIAKVALKSIKRAPLLWQLNGLCSWEPLRNPRPGYSIVIAGMHRLWPVAIANLRLISACSRRGLDEILLVMDESLDRLPKRFLELAEELQSGGLPLRIVGYDEQQRRVAHRINWGWVYSWLSWSKGIAAAQTRRVILHDLDAMPIDPTIFHRLYAASEANNAQFQGSRFYSGNGITPDMQLVTTFEMTMDIEWVRRSVKPVDGFNQIRLIGGRYVDFDTWLAVQRMAPSRRLEPIDQASLVHPTQLICQFTDHVAGREGSLNRGHQLPILLYFAHVGDASVDLTEAGSRIEDAGSMSAPLFGRDAELGRIQPQSWAWMEKQIRRLEQHLHGGTRPHVDRYLRGFATRAGDSRTVGREALEAGGVEER